MHKLVIANLLFLFSLPLFAGSIASINMKESMVEPIFLAGCTTYPDGSIDCNDDDSL
jgi:hypothetical protein